MSTHILSFVTLSPWVIKKLKPCKISKSFYWTYSSSCRLHGFYLFVKIFEKHCLIFFWISDFVWKVTFWPFLNIFKYGSKSEDFKQSPEVLEEQEDIYDGLIVLKPF